ncbi:MAG: hypothetical protein ACQERS_03875 [Bacteroidota bacterium]
MKKIILISIVLFTTLTSFGQLIRPNRPYLTFNAEPGYVTVNEFTAGYGLAGQTVPYSKHYFGFTTVHGYQANETFMIGGGTGLLFYNDGLLIPLYIDMRVRVNQGLLVPYLSGAGGLLLNPSDFDAGTRMFINPAAGILYPITRKLAADISAGFLMQMAPNIGRASFVNAKIGVTYKF